MQKEQVRNQVHQLRQEQPVAERNQKSGMIFRRLVSSSQWKDARTVMFYYPKPDEAETTAAISAALAGKKTVCLPAVDRGTETISAYKITSLDGLEKGPFGISEPKKLAANLVAPERIDLIVVPGVAFDVFGNRIGYGRGYYDKYLCIARNAAKVALAFDFQVCDGRLVCEPHDIALDLIITEKRSIVAKK